MSTSNLKGRTSVSPNDLDILIHCRTHSHEPHPRMSAPAVSATHEYYLREDIIEINPKAEDRAYRLTAKGRAWLDMILATPMPVMKWIDPRDHDDEYPS